jgi:hypothetical protein
MKKPRDLKEGLVFCSDETTFRKLLVRYYSPNWDDDRPITPRKGWVPTEYPCVIDFWFLRGDEDPEGSAWDFGWRHCILTKKEVKERLIELRHDLLVLERLGP